MGQKKAPILYACSIERKGVHIREVSSFQDVYLERASTIVRFPPLPTSKGLLMTLKMNSGLYILSLSLVL